VFREHPELEAVTQNLSICTFRYVPRALRGSVGTEETETLLNRLNQELLSRMETGGEAFLSKAVVGGKFLLRMCIVNFRTGVEDVEALAGVVARAGEGVWAEMEAHAFHAA
jgi:glutamate/tyrosine decarboxylase-like PLP-dependent enzyme